MKQIYLVKFFFLLFALLNNCHCLIAGGVSMEDLAEMIRGKCMWIERQDNPEKCWIEKLLNGYVVMATTAVLGAVIAIATKNYKYGKCC